MLSADTHAHGHALNSRCCWRDLALLSAEVLPARAGSGWGSNCAPCLSHRTPANRPLECRAQNGPSNMREVGVKNFQKVHSESCLAYRKVTSHAPTEKGFAHAKQGVRWALLPSWVNRGLVLPCTPSPCTALTVLAPFLLKEEFTSENLNEKNTFWIIVDSFVQDPQMWWGLLQGCSSIQNTYSKSLINNSEHISQLHIIFSTIS